MTDPQPIPPEPGARGQQPHDVLAAEEFAMPGPDAGRARGPVKLPADPSGRQGPHDVLAAEEFAMPAARNSLERSDAPAPQPAGRIRMFPLLGALGLGVAALLRRRRARRA